MIEKFERYFPIANENRMVYVYLPQDYDNDDERYPVMYMFDGQNLFEDETATFGTCWGIADFLNQWDKKMIVVGVQCSSSGLQRANEYLSGKHSSSFIGEIDGCVEQTIDWYIHDLKPFIDQNYRTWPHREATGVAGSSFGGAAAAIAITKFNDVFSKAALVSPSVTMIDQQLLKVLKTSHMNEDTRVFFSWGESEAKGSYRQYWLNTMYNLERFMQYRGWMTYMYQQQDGGHNESSWAKHVGLWLDFLWK